MLITSIYINCGSYNRCLEIFSISISTLHTPRTCLSIMSSPKNKRPTASSKSFPDFPRSIPRLSRGASMFSPQNHQSCGSCGSSPRVRLMVTVISRDHSGDLLPDATGTTRHRCFRDRYLHGKFPGWGYFRRPKVDACSCDSKFFFVKRSKVAEKNDKFDIHWTSVLRIQYTSSLQAEFYSREFCWKCKIWMKLLQLLWVDACWFLPQMPDTTSKVQRPRSSEPLQKKIDTKTPNLEYMT